MADLTHRERALITIQGGQADYVPTFELVFHETERDFDGRAFFGVKGGPDPTGVNRMETLRHNARLMLDTTAVSGFFRGDEGIRESIACADELFLNPVVIGELLAGFSMGRRERKNREALRELVSSPRMRVIDMDAETSERYAAIYAHLRKAGTPIPTNHLWIAASAMQYGLKLLTLDKHFLQVPQVITILPGPAAD